MQEPNEKDDLCFISEIKLHDLQVRPPSRPAYEPNGTGQEGLIHTSGREQRQQIIIT